MHHWTYLTGQSSWYFVGFYSWIQLLVAFSLGSCVARSDTVTATNSSPLSPVSKICDVLSNRTFKFWMATKGHNSNLYYSGNLLDPPPQPTTWM